MVLIIKKLKTVFGSSKSVEISTAKQEPGKYIEDEIDLTELFRRKDEELPKLSVIVVKEIRAGIEDLIISNIRAGNILLIKINPEELQLRMEIKNTWELIKSKIKDYGGRLYQVAENLIIALPPKVNLVKLEESFER
ncbi:MAG: hypothetical protein GXO42_01945 [bacterium]|nr:hypothetical protein [bacterium]